MRSTTGLSISMLLRSWLARRTNIWITRTFPMLLFLYLLLSQPPWKYTEHYLLSSSAHYEIRPESARYESVGALWTNRFYGDCLRRVLRPHRPNDSPAGGTSFSHQRRLFCLLTNTRTLDRLRLHPHEHISVIIHTGASLIAHDLPAFLDSLPITSFFRSHK